MKLYQIKVRALSKIRDAWYWLMKPVAYFYTTEKINARYEKRKSKITEDKMVKWIAEDIIRYLIKNKKSEIEFLVCTFAREDDFWVDCYLTGTAPYYLKRSKTKTAFYKFKKTLEIQEKIIDELKRSKYLNVTEFVKDYSWRRVDNYRKTVEITYKSN